MNRYLFAIVLTVLSSFSAQGNAVFSEALFHEWQQKIDSREETDDNTVAYLENQLSELDEEERRELLTCSGYSHSPKEETLLYTATENGKLKTAQLLLKHGADPNARNAFNTTPFVLAVVTFKGIYKQYNNFSFDILEKFLKKGAKASIESHAPRMPEAALSCFIGQYDDELRNYLNIDKEAYQKLVELLNKYPESLKPDETETVKNLAALSDAIKKKFTYTFESSLKKNQRIINRLYEEKTLLHTAAYAGNDDAVKLLLKYGANPTLCDSQGKRPDFYANNEIRSLLLQSDFFYQGEIAFSVG